jgi:eukaryotic-like serine/threonine-protein kinase
MALEQNSLLYGRYRIEAILGRGGMGAVYKAVDENLGIHVAVKENLFTTEEYARQFRREATLLAALRHPNLPRVTDHFVIPGQGQYLVMDYIEGEDLRSRIDRGALPTERLVVDWGRQVCEALVYLHGCQPPVIHRDIKPGNIRITPDGRALLVDFGLARVMEGAQTTTGAKAMTPGYSPPEQYGASRTDVRTDIYSLAATLYTLVTGSIPEDGLERALGQHTLTPIRSRNPKISPTVAETIEKALSVLPENRFQNAAEFRDSLTSHNPPSTIPREVKQAPPILPPSAEKAAAVPPPPPKKPSSRPGCFYWLFPFFGALAGLVLVALVIMWLAGGLSPSAVLSAIGIGVNGPLVPQNAAAGTPPAALLETPLPQATPTPTPKELVSPTAEPVIERATPIGRAQMISFAKAKDTVSPAQIFTMNLDGTNLQQITDFPEGACQPDWSPDGTRMLFISPCLNLTANHSNTTIYAWIPAKTGEKKLVKPEMVDQLRLGPGGGFDPAWSRDGKQIAFTSVQGGNRGIYYIDAAGKNKPQRVSAAGAIEYQPRWSADGKQLVFTSITNGYNVFKSDLDGSKLTQIPRIDSRPQTQSPDWNPDGSLILFLLKDNGKMYIASLDDLSIPTLRSDTYASPRTLSARFSPDGSRILFDMLIDGTSGQRNLRMFRITGSKEPDIVTSDYAVEFDPAWRPMPAAK